MHIDWESLLEGVVHLIVYGVTLCFLSAFIVAGAFSAAIAGFWALSLLR